MGVQRRPLDPSALSPGTGTQPSQTTGRNGAPTPREHLEQGSVPEISPQTLESANPHSNHGSFLAEGLKGPHGDAEVRTQHGTRTTRPPHSGDLGHPGGSPSVGGGPGLWGQFSWSPLDPWMRPSTPTVSGYSLEIPGLEGCPCDRPEAIPARGHAAHLTLEGSSSPPCVLGLSPGLQRLSVLLLLLVSVSPPMASFPPQADRCVCKDPLSRTGAQTRPALRPCGHSPGT